MTFKLCPYVLSKGLDEVIIFESDYLAGELPGLHVCAPADCEASTLIHPSEFPKGVLGTCIVKAPK